MFQNIVGEFIGNSDSTTNLVNIWEGRTSIVIMLSRDSQCDCEQPMQMKCCTGMMQAPVWEQPGKVHNDPWQVVPKQVFPPYFHFALVVLCCIGCLWIAGLTTIEPHREKTGFLPMRKQRRRSASR